MEEQPRRFRPSWQKANSAVEWIERCEQTTKTDDLNTLSDAQLAAIIKGDQPEKTQHWSARLIQTSTAQRMNVALN